MTRRMSWYRWAMHMGICALIVLGTISNALSYLALLLCAGAILLSKEEDALNLLLMMMPFANIFKSGPGVQSYFTYVLILYVGWRFVQNLRVSKTFAVILLFAAWVFAVQLAADTLNITRSIKFILNFMFLYYSLGAAQKVNYNNIFLSYILGVIFSSIVVASGVFSRIPLYVEMENVGEVIEYREVIRFSGLYGDPNCYAVNVILSLCLLIIMFHQGSIGGTWIAIGAVILVYCALMTRSKSALIMLAWPFVLFMYSNSKKRKLLLQGFAICGVTVFLWLIFEDRVRMLDTVLGRIESADSLDTLTTGRTRLWRDYGEYFLNNSVAVLIGNGLGAALLNGRAAHNTYIDGIYHLGIVGSFFMLALIASMRNILPRNNSRNVLNYSVLVCICIMYAFLSQLFYFDMAYHIFLAVIVLHMEINRSPLANN